MLKLTSFAVAAFLFIAMAATAGSAQTAADKKSKKQNSIPAAKGVKTEAGSKAASDPNIKSGTLENTGKAIVREAKDGAKAVQLCRVIFDNYTDLVIKTYVDGGYEGLMGRMGELSTYAVAGRTVVYARADYTDGSYRSWGPVTFNCAPGESYTWKIEY